MKILNTILFVLITVFFLIAGCTLKSTSKPDVSSTSQLIGFWEQEKMFQLDQTTGEWIEQSMRMSQAFEFKQKEGCNYQPIEKLVNCEQYTITDDTLKMSYGELKWKIVDGKLELINEGAKVKIIYKKR